MFQLFCVFFIKKFNFWCFCKIACHILIHCYVHVYVVDDGDIT